MYMCVCVCVGRWGVEAGGQLCVTLCKTFSWSIFWWVLGIKLGWSSLVRNIFTDWTIFLPPMTNMYVLSNQ